jgi:Flp pilus assembly protein TadG
MKSANKRYTDKRGNELLEFALVLPLLLLMLTGAVEFGRAFYTYNILTKSVRNAARYLSASQMSLGGTVGAGYVGKAQTLAMYGNVDGAGTKILPDLNSADITVSGTATPGPSTVQFYVTVSADYPYTPLFGFGLSGVHFRPKVTMLFVGIITGT